MDIDSEIIKFREDWEINFPEKIINRKKIKIFRALKEIIFKPKYPVIALYRFAHYHLATQDGVVWPNFIERGVGNEVAGVPSWFEISEEWNIPKKDINSLFLGPLVKGEETLVPALPENGFFMSAWELIKILATIGGAIGFIIMVINAL